MLDVAYTASRIFRRLHAGIAGSGLALNFIGASRDGDISAVRRILRRRAVLEMPSRAKSDYLALGLLEAASAGHPPVVRALLDAGATVDRPYAVSGDTAMGIAAFAGYDEVVALLVGAGADPNVANEVGVTPFMLAAGACAYSAESGQRFQAIVDRACESAATAADSFFAVHDGSRG